MKRFEMDILNLIFANPPMGQRNMAQRSGYSIGLVNNCLHTLEVEGYLDQEKGTPTTKARRLFEQSRPSRAIILAAGYGMRMVPINTEMSKGLLCVNGEVLIERLIRQLHEVGIYEIAVVVGFMKESYEYLIDRYEVKLLVNPEYGSKNNLFSMLCAKDWINNCYILPCDIWCHENPFSKYELYSWYMVSEQQSSESNMRINRKRELVTIKRGEIGNRMVGIAYFTADDSRNLRTRIETLAQTGNQYDAFWEEVLYTDTWGPIAARIIEDDLVREINTYEQLKELDSGSVHLKSKALCVAAEALQVAREELHDLAVLKKGMTNRSFTFACRGERYIMRIPGEGTDQLINRAQEAEVYHTIAGKNLCDDPIYLDPSTGYKLTKFLDNVRVCDPNNIADLQRCMKKLKEFHNMRLKVDHEFDIFGQIEFYEKLWGEEPSVYRDYKQTKENVFTLRSYIDDHACEKVLTHIDAVPDNFLFYEQDGKELLQLTDWEYAGMQDPHVDIAMFCIYALYDREQVDQLIDIYFENTCSHEIRLKIYCYISVCGLLWSNWCEYKRSLGVEFGEYSLRQYRYAKEYYRLFQREFSGAQSEKALFGRGKI